MRAIALRERYLTAAKKRIEEVRWIRKQVPKEEIWDATMAFPLVWDSDVKGWIADRKKTGRAQGIDLKSRRVPPPGEGHVIQFTGRRLV